MDTWLDTSGIQSIIVGRTSRPCFACVLAAVVENVPTMPGQAIIQLQTVNSLSLANHAQ